MVLFRKDVYYQGTSETNPDVLLEKYSKPVNTSPSNTNIHLLGGTIPPIEIKDGENSAVITYSAARFNHNIKKEHQSRDDSRLRIGASESYAKITIYGSKNILLFRVKMRGEDNKAINRCLTAVTIQYSRNIHIYKGSFSGYFNAIHLYRSTNVIIHHCYIRNIRQDGIFINRCNKVLIRNNTINSFKPNYDKLNLSKLIDRKSTKSPCRKNTSDRVVPCVSPNQNRYVNDRSTWEEYDHSDYIQLSDCEDVIIYKNRLGTDSSQVWNQSILIKLENSELRKANSNNIHPRRSGEFLKFSNSNGKVKIDSYLKGICIEGNIIKSQNKHGINICGYGGKLALLHKRHLRKYSSYSPSDRNKVQFSLLKNDGKNSINKFYKDSTYSSEIKTVWRYLKEARKKEYSISSHWVIKNECIGVFYNTLKYNGSRSRLIDNRDFYSPQIIMNSRVPRIDYLKSCSEVFRIHFKGGFNRNSINLKPVR